MNDATAPERSSRMGRIIGLFAFAFFAGAAGTYLVRQGAPRVKPEPPANAAVTPTPAAPSLSYTPPPNRSPGMQAFDKALLYLIAQQEPDGHWSARKTRAAEDFCNENGDVTLTAIGAYALMSAMVGGNDERTDLVEGSRRALKWLKGKVRDDGAVSDPEGPGHPVAAQLFAGLAFHQAATTSPRDEWKSLLRLTSQYAMQKMMAKSGGFGVRAGEEHARMDMTALGGFLYILTLQSGIRFSEGEDLQTLGVEIRIEKDLQRAVRAMRVAPEKKDGVFRMSTSGGDADFEATLVALLGQLMSNIPPQEYAPGVTFLIGKPSNGEFPGPGEKLRWGDSGEGYRALSLWLGTLAFWLHGETTQEYKAWRKAVESAVLPHQLPDGSWPAAGADATYGRMWRTTFTGFSLLMLNPTPPPAGAPGATGQTGAAAPPK